MPCAIDSNDFTEFQKLLVGTWTNKGVPTAKDGKPFSYNVMPLPQVEHQGGKGHPCCDGYILKNFAFTETLRFNGSAFEDDPGYDPDAVAVTALAPNRGGRYTQDCHALFYDQQVKFAEGPEDGAIVHVENGAWLHLFGDKQSVGPYDPNMNGPYEPGPIIPQPSDITIAKQIAVPHGNSVLALGNFDEEVKEKPVIPDAEVPVPSPSDIPVHAYVTKLNTPNDYENPNPDWTWNPNKPLQLVIAELDPNAFIHWQVTTDPLENGQGIVTNIPFEQRRAKVTCYRADYWLLSKDEGSTYDYLAYTQTIIMEIPLQGQIYRFPHVTTNTVKRKI